MSSLIEEKLDNLKTTYGYSDDELYDIRCIMVDYTMAALYDSKIREEVWKESALQGMEFNIQKLVLQ